VTQPTPEHYSEPDQAKWSFVGFIVGVLVTVLALKYYGYLVFPQAQERAVVEEFKILSLNPDTQSIALPESSDKEAVCQYGYLLLRPQNGDGATGILVDKKNRGIACQESLIPTEDK